MIDANFRLKRRVVSSDEIDPSLSRGWAYFVEEASYKSHISDRAEDTQEVHFFTTWVKMLSDILTCRKARAPATTL